MTAITSPSFVPSYALPYTASFNKRYYRTWLWWTNAAGAVLLVLAAVFLGGDARLGAILLVAFIYAIIEVCLIGLYFYRRRTKLTMSDDQLTYRRFFGSQTVPLANITKLSYFRHYNQGSRSFVDVAQITVSAHDAPDLVISYKPFKLQDVAVLIDAVAKHAPNVVFGDNIFKLWQGSDPDMHAHNGLGYTISDTSFQPPETPGQ